MIRRRMLIGGALVTLISFRATKTAQPKKLRDIGFVEGRNVSTVGWLGAMNS